MRRFHSLAGLFGAVVVMFMAITGAILSLQPALETAAARAWSGLANVAELAGAVASALPGVERITRAASGLMVAYYTQDGVHEAAQIDPANGAVMGPYEPQPFFAFITELHRSLFMGDMGHAVAGIASVAIAILAASGVFLLVARMGGWRRLFARVKGTGLQRLHTYLARLALVALAITSLSGAFMSAVNFGFVPDGSGGFGFAALPTSQGTAAAPIGKLAALASTPLSDLRELVFPASGDLGDVFTLTTSAGKGYVDQATGQLLSFTANNFWQQLYEAIYVLHTGQGAWWLALILGVAALAVPAMAVSGIAIWLQRRRNGAHLPKNASWRTASTVILVGSENNSTAGFAAALHRALVAAGERVHTAPMNSVRLYPRAERLLVLSATYGDGGHPASASRFLSQLERLATAPAPAFAVLGFGDRSFANYCAFAEAVDAALAGSGARPLLDFDTVDRQSSQDFARWGQRLGEAIGLPLELSHTPAMPEARGLVLVEREEFGFAVDAPTAILRFAPPQRSGVLARLGIGGGLPRFSVGDLVGIIPPGSTVPRYYSLASSSREGLLEICVRKQPGGVCSEFLHGLIPGERIKAFVRRNPDFRPARGNRPLILIGAGTGVAPLAGFVRNNRPGRPAYLFFGARHPASDFLYRGEFASAMGERRLSALDVAFSRVVDGQYVQHRLAAEAELLRELIAAGAQVLVCGGLEMARDVRATLDAVLAPLALSTSELKSRGRYIEDAY